MGGTMEEPPVGEEPLPRHVAIVMDGNGRWARSHGLPRVEGHQRGAQTVRSVVRGCRRRGIRALTLYAFSAQNWRRPSDEVSALMRLLYDYVHQERDEILDNGIRFRTAGDLGRLPEFVRRSVDELSEASRDNDHMDLTLALAYGGREDIVQAVRRLAKEVQAGRLDPDAIDEAELEDALWTRGLPADVDLVIRTGGDKRVSNFLLWQIAYAEFWFTDVPWPAFTLEHLDEALREFARRERRFGDLPEARR